MADRCKSCPAPVFWVRTAKAKMLIDSAPSPQGTLVIVERRDLVGNVSKVAESFVADDPRHQGLTRYTSHFATCPEADQHRRKR